MDKLFKIILQETQVVEGNMLDEEDLSYLKPLELKKKISSKKYEEFDSEDESSVPSDIFGIKNGGYEMKPYTLLNNQSPSPVFNKDGQDESPVSLKIEKKSPSNSLKKSPRQ
jgi:hypothetical protein